MTPSAPKGQDLLSQVASAYQGLEDPAAFADDAALARYRSELLGRSAEQTTFVAALLPERADVLEAACGNGRLLVSLAQAGRLRHGHGVDIATSRINFARRWIDDERLDVLTFESADLLTAPLMDTGYDAALLITGALAYFGAAGEQLPRAVLNRLSSALRPGGLLVLELYPHVHERALLGAAGGHVRLWRELPPEDPWRFYLSDLRLDGDVLTHRKTFVHRTSGVIDEGRCEYLTLYTPDQLRALLVEAGLTDVTFHAGWTDAPYDGGELLVVTARSPR